MKIISPNRRSTDTLFNSKALQGKKVLSEKGAYAGTLTNIFTDTESFNGIGVTYKRTEYFVDSVHIHKASKDAVILTIHPFYLLIGKQTYSETGEYLGKIIDVTREGNRNKAGNIVIKKHFWSSKLSIKTEKIMKAKEVVIVDNN